MTHRRPPEDRAHAAALLASSGLTRSEIAERVGISRKTLYLWLDEPEFQAQVQGYAAAAEDAIRAKLREAGGAMVDVLRDIAQDGEQESNRRQAAKDVLTFILGNRTEVKHSGGLHVEQADPAQLADAAEKARQDAEAARSRLAALEAGEGEE